jgi:hypothetical protein
VSEKGEWQVDEGAERIRQRGNELADLRKGGFTEPAGSSRELDGADLDLCR